MKLKTFTRAVAVSLAAAMMLPVCSMGVVMAGQDHGQGNSETAASQTEPAPSAAVQEEPMEANGYIDPDGSAADGISQGSSVSFGVVSDTHVTASKQTEQSRLRKAFEFYSTAGVDRMVVAGDLTDGGSQSEYDTWKSIKDSSLGIPLIASMGNHEGNSADRFITATGNKPNDNKVVNGYHFITVSPGSGSLDTDTGKSTSHGGGSYSHTLTWLREQLQAAVAEDPSKPIFVFFHHPIKDTFYVSNEWYGSGLEEVFKEYPQVVSFSGHIHSPNNNPTSIWQDGGYTAVNTVTLSYMEMETGMIYGSVPPNASQIAQGLVVEANGSMVTIKNYDFLADKWIPQTWTFDVTKVLPYTDEREEGSSEPYFEEADKVTVDSVTDTSATVTFDQASVAENEVGDLVHSYRYDVVNQATNEVVNSFKTWSEYYMQPMPEKLTQVVPDLQAGTAYELRIYAINAYQKVSENYISTVFTTTGSEEDRVPGFDDMIQGVRPADLLDVDFSEQKAEDHSGTGHAVKGSDGSNIVMNADMNKEVASFTGKSSEVYTVDWSDDDYAKSNDGFTVESTFMVNEFSGSYVDLIGNMESAGVGLEISKGDDGKATLEGWVHLNGSYKIPTAESALEYGKWYHTVLTYDGNQVTLYLNGIKIESKEGTGAVKTPAAASRYFVLGGDCGSNGSIQSPMTGAISTVRIYSDPLSVKEVSMLAARELPGLDTQNPLIQVSAEPSSTGKVGEKYNIPAAAAADNSTRVELTVTVTDAAGNAVELTEEPAAESPYSFIPEVDGEFTLGYTAKDPSGNTAEEVYKIAVEKKQEDNDDDNGGGNDDNNGGGNNGGNNGSANQPNDNNANVNGSANRPQTITTVTKPKTGDQTDTGLFVLLGLSMTAVIAGISIKKVLKK